MVGTEAAEAEPVKRVCGSEESTLVEAGLWRVEGEYKSDDIYTSNNSPNTSGLQTR
jgi:hypothetical protein